MITSVLLCSYQAGPYLQPALEGLRQQRHGGWELRVLERGDDTISQDVVQTFRRTVRQPVHFERAPGLGAAAARNRLLDAATGEAVALLEPDEWWENDHLERNLARLAAGADVSVSGLRRHQWGTGRELGSYHPPGALADDPVQTLFRQPCVLTTSAAVLRRPALVPDAAFDPAMRAASARDFWFRLALDGKRFSVVPTVTCHRPEPADPRPGGGAELTEACLRFYLKYRHSPAVPRALRRRQLALSYLAHARATYQVNRSQALWLLLQACRLRPLSLRTWDQLATLGRSRRSAS